MIKVGGKEDTVAKREKHSSFVYAENVELLPTKVVKPEAPKRTPPLNVHTYSFV
jgi:hypothetical protein